MESFLSQAYNPEALEAELQEDGAISFMAWYGEEAVGFVRLRRNPEVAHVLGENSIEIQRLYVHPRHQGKKIGSLLMQQSVDHARQSGCEWIWLGVWEHNYRAQEFYQQWNFERFGEHVFQMGDDPQIDWLFRLRIK